MRSCKELVTVTHRHQVTCTKRVYSVAGTLYIHFRGLLPRRNFATCKIHFASKSCAFSYIGSVTARHSRSVVTGQPNLAAWYKEWNYRTFAEGAGRRHLYLAGRPSHWVSAHILLLFFLAYSQPSHIGRLPYFHTRCGLSANLECRSEMCCMWLAENTGRRNGPKFAIWAPSHNFVWL